MIKVRVPATSANCSIGFDTLGLALDWRSTIGFERADTFSITGCPAQFAAADNLVYQAFVYTCKKKHRQVPVVHIHIDSDIPFARGLGSSSQCVAAGILGADALLDLRLSLEDKLALAVELEGHPDNVAPALLGGMCACIMEGDHFDYQNFGACSWQALAVVPAYEVSTPEARKVLPAAISLADASKQVGRAMLFEYAWIHGQEKRLAACCQDVLHEPARKALIAEYETCHALARQMEIPFWISGSGSTLLFVSQDRARLEEVERILKEKELPVQMRHCAISDQGADVQYG